MEIFMQSAVFKMLKIHEIPIPNKINEPELPDDEEGNAFCGNCVFWDKDEDEESIGECRRNPPQVITLADEDGTMTPVSIFPASEADHWCGEHQEE
jgi:hypothetical protein